MTSLPLFSQAKAKPKDSPECSNITKACETAGFSLGSHKTKQKGLWADCIGKLAKGEPVEGVAGINKEDALKCIEFSKEKRTEKK